MTSPTESRVRVVFVCMGNICRSPLAEGVFRHLVATSGLVDRFVIESAGTGAWHVGEPPNLRMQLVADENEVSLEGQTARQFVFEDFESFDHIFAMDKDNLQDILSLDRNEAFSHKVRLFRELDPEPGDFQVPDPYYGGEKGFHHVYDIVLRTAVELLERLSEEHGLEKV